MRRDPPETPAPRPTRIIPADALFKLVELREVLGLPKSTLKREVRLKRLRVSLRAGCYWITGRWVMEWIESGEKGKKSAE